jgi:hypothetical protein
VREPLFCIEYLTFEFWNSFFLFLSSSSSFSPTQTYVTNMRIKNDVKPVQLSWCPRRLLHTWHLGWTSRAI